MSRTPRPTDDQIEAMLEEASSLYLAAGVKEWNNKGRMTAQDALDQAYHNGIWTAMNVVLGYESPDELFADE